MIRIKDYFGEKINRQGTSSYKWDLCKEQFGKSDVLPMWVADMDFKSPIEVIEAIKKRAEHGIYGYTVIPPGLNEAIVNWQKSKFNWQIKNDWIIHTPGVVSSINVAIQAFTNRGDNILIQTPVYYPFYSCISENGRNIIKNSLINTNENDNSKNKNVEIDFDDLAEKLPKVKMMILCSPHNPIGRVWRKEELIKIIDLCMKYNVLLVSDEIHCDLVYKGFKHIPIQSIAAEKNNIITLISPTKTFNIAGLSESIAIIENEQLKRKFLDVMSANGTNMLNTFGLVAAEAAYKSGSAWLGDLMLYLEGNLNYLMEYFDKNIKQIKAIKPEATYLVWLDCRELNVEFDKLKDFFVNKANVGLNDGSIFGEEGRGYQRLNFACPRSILEEGLYRIKNAVDLLNG